MIRVPVARRRLALRATLLVALVGLAACGDDSGGGRGSATTEGSTSAPRSVSLRAGLNDPEDPTIAVLEFLPEAVTVAAGTTVEWTFPASEAHSVTFLPPGQALPPPGSDPSLFAPKPPVGPYDGRTLVNSGLLPAGPGPAAPFKVTFPEPGEFRYLCVIHPQMTGSVKVVAEGAEADQQRQITERGDKETSQWLEEGRAAKKKLVEAPLQSEETPGGRTNWRVAMGVTTPHTDVLAFAPVPALVKAGDQVTFVNDTLAPHTATFPGRTGSLPQDPGDPRAARPAPGPSPQTLNAEDFFNTGELPPNAPPGSGPPEQARSFTFVVPRAGDYSYVCVFHAASRMVGTIKAT